VTDNLWALLMWAPIIGALSGMLAGVTLSDVLLAPLMANAGGAWDNAKKYNAQGNLAASDRRCIERPWSVIPLAILSKTPQGLRCLS
jgi:Na+/H+-translocating membrane pyrophosphatase